MKVNIGRMVRVTGENEVSGKIVSQVNKDLVSIALDDHSWASYFGVVYKPFKGHKTVHVQLKKCRD